MPKKASGKPDALVVQDREVSAQWTQADRKESLSSHSSEGQKALRKPNALFSSEQGKLIKSSFFGNANPSNLRGSLLEGNKDHLLNQARSARASCGVLERFQVSGRMFVGSSNSRIWQMGSSSAWRILHSPRSCRHPLDRSELPSRGMAPPGFC